MKGRKPYPFQVMQATNDKNKLTKEQLAERKKNEPKVKSNALKCPSHLSDDAKKEWKRITKLYAEIEQPIMSDLDMNALEVYCEALVTYRKALQKMQETSEVILTMGGPKKNPWHSVAKDAALQIKAYGEILLLNPVSRARVGIAKKLKEEDEDPMAKLLIGGRPK